jgi:hypothetical protein
VLSVETSRSAIVDREACDRLRLQSYELDGTGYQPKAGSVAALSGIHIHEGFSHLLAPGGDPTSPERLAESIAVMHDGFVEAFEKHGVRQALTEDVTRVLAEQKFMLEVMLRGWVKVRMPEFLETYEVMSVERAWRWELAPGIILPFRMDAITRRRDDGLLHIHDFKGAGSVDGVVRAKYEDSRQTILYLTALEEYTDEPVGGIVYEYINRGSFKADGAEGSPFYQQRIQQSPMTYGYVNRGEIDRWEAKYQKTKGWQKVPAWEEHSAEEWVEFLAGKGILQGLYAGGVPVNPPPSQRQSMRRQIAIQERDYFLGLEQFNKLRAKHGDDTHPEVQAHLEAWSIQKTEHCNKFGADYQCSFRNGNLCFLKNGMELLREEPGFMPRVPHHLPEVAA